MYTIWNTYRPIHPDICELSWCFLRKDHLCSQHFVHVMNDKSGHHPQCITVLFESWGCHNCCEWREESCCLVAQSSRNDVYIIYIIHKSIHLLLYICIFMFILHVCVYILPTMPLKEWHVSVCFIDRSAGWERQSIPHNDYEHLCRYTMPEIFVWAIGSHVYIMVYEDVSVQQVSMYLQHKYT